MNCWCSWSSIGWGRSNKNPKSSYLWS